MTNSYAKYPVDAFEHDDKPTAVAIAVADAAGVEPLPPAQTPKKSCLCRVGHALLLLVFHLLNAILGIGGSIIVLVTFPLCVVFVPLGCTGALLFQILAAVTRWMAMADVALVNMTRSPADRLKVAYGIQSGFSTNIGRSGVAARLFFVSPKTLLVMLYLAVIKLAIGVLSCIVVEGIVGNPVEVAARNGGAVMFGDDFTYDNHPTAYVWVVVGLFLLGAALLYPVWWLSAKLTAHFCSDRDELDDVVDIETPRFADDKLQQ